jgi:hypothetical protein
MVATFKVNIKNSNISEILIRHSKANNLQNNKTKLNYCRHHVELKNKSDISNNMSNWNNVRLFRKYLSNVPGKHNVKTIYKTAILVTAHMLWKALMAKYKTYITGNNITLHCKHRIAAKLYIIKTWFISDI